MTVEETEPRSLVTRRTVLHVGAHAAWTIPVIGMVTYPASAAVTSGAAQMTIAATRTTWDSKGLTTTLVVTNTGSQPTTALQVTVTFSAGGSQPRSTSVSTPGKSSPTWSYLSGGATTITYAPSAQLGAGASSTFTLTVTTNHNGSGTVTAAAIPGSPGSSGSTPVA